MAHWKFSAYRGSAQRIEGFVVDWRRLTKQRTGVPRLEHLRAAGTVFGNPRRRDAAGAVDG